MSKQQDVQTAIGAIADSSTVAILGCGGGTVEPDLLIAELARRFGAEGAPRDLTLVHSCGLGDRATRGLAPLAQQGLVKRAIGGHWGQTPAMSAMAERNEIEAYNLPLGVMMLLHRETGGRRPGVVTKVGLGTFADPRIEGGRMNARTTEQLVELIDVDGEEHLLYRSYPIDVAFLRGRRADADGNVSLLGEPAYLDALALALAAKASGGTVIVQVKEVLPPGEQLPATEVKLPGIAVDVLVEHPGQQQTYESEDDPVYGGLARRDLAAQPMPLTPRKVIARRSAQALSPDSVVSVGVGMPDGVGAVLGEEGLEQEITLTMETGIIGGVAAPGVLFGAGMNFRAMVDGADVIDFYHGGGLDAAVLGFAEVDAECNVNVSKYNGVAMGSGGFVDISQSAGTVVFCGTFTARGLDARVDDGGIRIEREGQTRKFVPAVEQITFSGAQALRTGQRVLVVTERAVFELRPEGLTLIELASGADLQRDVLDQMGFAPRVAEPLATMDAALFGEQSLGLVREWLSGRA